MGIYKKLIDFDAVALFAKVRTLFYEVNVNNRLLNF